MQEELSISTTDAGTVIMRDTKLVMPSSLQQQTLDLAHEGHQGITKTKALLRSKVWFPNIDKMIEEKVSKCIACAANDNRQKNEPLFFFSFTNEDEHDFMHGESLGDFLILFEP